MRPGDVELDVIAIRQFIDTVRGLHDRRRRIWRDDGLTGRSALLIGSRPDDCQLVAEALKARMEVLVDIQGTTYGVDLDGTLTSEIEDALRAVWLDDQIDLFGGEDDEDGHADFSILGEDER